MGTQSVILCLWNTTSIYRPANNFIVGWKEDVYTVQGILVVTWAIATHCPFLQKQRRNCFLQTQPWIIIQPSGNCLYKQSHSVAHSGANQSRGSSQAERQALCLCWVSITEQVFPWKSLTFIWPCMGTFPPPPPVSKDMETFWGLHAEHL